MGQIPFRANPLRADDPSSSRQPSGVMARADILGAKLASEGKEDEEEGQNHEDGNETAHARSSVARYVWSG